MRFSTIAFIAGLVAVSNAHFQLQFPPPRGPFDMNNEPTFCDGFDTSVNNRTQFPLSGGFFSLNSEHPLWTATVLVSTAQNPTSFNNFSQAIPFFQLSGEGIFCIPLNLASTNVTGLKDGSNITIQIEFDGGDGQLFQCADLTLSSSVSIANVPCSNATGPSSSASSSSTAPASTPTSGVGRVQLNYIMAVLTLAGVSLMLA